MGDREKHKARNEEPDVEAHGKKAGLEGDKPGVEDVPEDDRPDVEAHGKKL